MIKLNVKKQKQNRWGKTNKRQKEEYKGGEGRRHQMNGWEKAYRWKAQSSDGHQRESKISRIKKKNI